MTAPERMPDKLLIKLVDNPNSVCDGMYINAAGGNEYTRTDIHQAALDRIAELEGALGECVEVLALKENPDAPDPQHHERVKALGQEIGFGALMSTASCGWRECAKDQGIAGSEFVAGPCYVTVVETLSLARAVLAKGGG